MISFRIYTARVHGTFDLPTNARAHTQIQKHKRANMYARIQSHRGLTGSIRLLQSSSVDFPVELISLLNSVNGIS